jgi:hypothetical protein
MLPSLAGTPNLRLTKIVEEILLRLPTCYGSMASEIALQRLLRRDFVEKLEKSSIAHLAAFGSDGGDLPAAGPTSSPP